MWEGPQRRVSEAPGGVLGWPQVLGTCASCEESIGVTGGHHCPQLHSLWVFSCGSWQVEGRPSKPAAGCLPPRPGQFPDATLSQMDLRA